MKKTILSLALVALVHVASAQAPGRMPYAYKWLGDKEVAFTYNGRYTDDDCFKLVFPKGVKVEGVKAPEKFSDFPISNPIVKKLIKERYGNKFDPSEQLVSPNALYKSKLLKEVRYSEL